MKKSEGYNLMMSEAIKKRILEVRQISKEYPIERGILKRRTGWVKALDRVDFFVDEFDTLGIVGESGSGKTTLAKIILGLIPPSSGEIVFNQALIRDFRKDVQIIFQNPFNSLNPKMRILDAIAEPLLIHRIVETARIGEKVAELLSIVGLENDALTRYPAAFSGGQRQRICIARALACEPKFIVLDEPISSLDLTIQAKFLDLFSELKKKFNLTYIFISHNLAVVKHITDSLIVMRKGVVVEHGKTRDIFNHPGKGYTQELLDVARS